MLAVKSSLAPAHSLPPALICSEPKPLHPPPPPPTPHLHSFLFISIELKFCFVLLCGGFFLPVLCIFCLFLFSLTHCLKPTSMREVNCAVAICSTMTLSFSLPISPNSLSFSFSLSFFLLRGQHHVVLAEKKIPLYGECQICCLAFVGVLQYRCNFVSFFGDIHSGCIYLSFYAP